MHVHVYWAHAHNFVLIQEGLTSLMIAANAKTFNAVKLLVRYHCEVNIQNKVCI